ncbi:Piwi domain containing protein [Nitzschia inconspicua]|uniref:Piwi domain containing protein n=1 Tax=Nitzschia inconspicua TaxID=303405 RepID=A0A9K3L5A4_9STRA|nr:Piwi domain containing protein [Nitzschia inconspicua]
MMKRTYDNVNPGRGRNTGRARGRGHSGGGRGRGGYENRRGSYDSYDDQGYGGGGRGGSGGSGSRGPYGGGNDDRQGSYSNHGGRGRATNLDHYGGGGGGGGGGYSGGGSYGSDSHYQQDRPHHRGGGGQGRGGRYNERAGGRGHSGGRDGRGGGRGRGGRTQQYSPDMSGMNSVLSNIIMADVSPNFQFFLYPVQAVDSEGNHIESRLRRRFLFDTGLWDGLLQGMSAEEKEDFKRVIFFQGSFFFSARKIPGLEPEKLPVDLPLPVEKSEGDQIKVMQLMHYVTPIELQFKDTARSPERDGEVSFDKRCADCTQAFRDIGSLLQHCQQKGHRPVYSPAEEASKSVEPTPASVETFTSFINLALQRALSERLAKWGTEFIDPANMKEPVDKSGRSLGVRVYEAYSCQFNVIKATADSLPQVGLTADLRAKIVRTLSVMDHLVGDQDPAMYDPSHQERERCRREWIGETVISMHDKKCYSVTDLIFDQSAESMPVQGLRMSHAEYFAKRKGITLKYPKFRPMIAVLGRRNQTIHLPAELVAGNELEPRVKQQLPMIASYKPVDRNAAVEKIRSYLVPGAQKSKGAGGLLPAIGLQLADERLGAQAEVLQVPIMMAAGIQVPSSRAENWAPMLTKASFNIHPKESNVLNVVVFYNDKIRGAINIYNKIRDLVNSFNSIYRLSDKPIQLISTGDRERHWGAVEKCFADPSLNPENIFVLDFNKPRGSTDFAYPVIKQLLTRGGFLSQFINFNTYAHDSPRDQRRSEIILQGVARQILQKSGVRLWWVQIPQSIPTPTMIVGVDIFHAPHVYDPIAKKRGRKASCAAIIVQVFRDAGDQRSQKVEIYTQAFAREPGKEYDLADALQETVSSAMRELDVSPSSCIVMRDGIGDSAFGNAAMDEINGIRAGLLNQAADGSAQAVPLAYVVAQKRIATKFLSKGITGEPDGKYGAPSGTLVRGAQLLDYDTFYINGRAPPYSTAKPVRYIVVQKDEALKDVSLERLAWNLSHDYPNWTGPIKVPSVVQMAHKLAELGGSFADCGSSINTQQFKNKLHFL